MKAWLVRGAGLAVAGALAAAVMMPARAADESPRHRAAHDRLQKVIHQAIHGDGPLMLESERALIERKCGYAPGSWSGDNFSINNGVLHCENGRKVDDPEVRAMMEVAGPRIGKRVDAAMNRPEVKAAIEAVAQEASAEAIRKLARKWGKD